MHNGLKRIARRVPGMARQVGAQQHCGMHEVPGLLPRKRTQQKQRKNGRRVLGGGDGGTAWPQRRPAPFRQAGFKTGSSRYLEIDKRPATKPGHIIAGLIRLTKQKTVQLLHRKQLNSPVMNAPGYGALRLKLLRFAQNDKLFLCIGILFYYWRTVGFYPVR